MKKRAILAGILVVLTLFTAQAVRAEEGLYILDGMGGVASVGTMEAAPQGPYFGWDIARDLALSPSGEGYYVLSGDGQIHAVGGAEPISFTVFGFDIARKLVMAPVGHYVLDGYGVIHAFDGAPEFDYPVFAEPLAVDFELTPDGRGGYILDGLGGIHAVGEAPPLESIFFGWNIARDLVLNEDGSYYVMDGFGGIYSKGAVLINGPFFNTDTARRLSVSPSSGGAYLLDSYGNVHALQGAPELPNSDQPGWDLIVDFELSSSSKKFGAIEGVVDIQAPDSGALTATDVQDMVVRLEDSDHSTAVGSDGAFRLDGVQAGLYNLLIESPSRPDLKLRLESIRVTRGVTLDLGVLQLVPAGMISGVVTLEGESDHLGTDIYLAGTSLLAKTDHDGSFKIFYVPEGQYDLIVERAGFVRVEIQDVDVSAGDETVIDPIELKKIVNSRMGSVQGIVYRRANEQDLSLSKKKDPNQLIPVPGAEVTLCRVTSSTRNSEQLLQTRTDRQGAYSFQRVPAGAYKIKAAKEGIGQGEEEIVVEAGSTTEQNITIGINTNSKAKLVGTVIEDTGNLTLWKPIAGAMVSVEQPGQTTKSAITNRQGRYVIEGVQPGLRKVYAEKEGFKKEIKQAHFRPGQETTVDFRLKPIALEKGSVYGVVRGTNPQSDSATGTTFPLARALVVLYPERECPDLDAGCHNDMPVTRFSAWTNERGQYRIVEVPAGKYIAVAFKNDYVPKRAEIVVAAGAATEQNFLLVPKQEPELGAVKGMIIEDLCLDIVIPIPGATVAMLNMEGQVLRVTHSDDAGKYAFPRVPEGKYIGMADKEGYIPKRKEFFVEGGEVKIVNFALKKEPSSRPGAIYGYVTTVSDTISIIEPVPDARVILLPIGVRWDSESGIKCIAPGVPPRVVRTDSDGAYRFDEVPPGQYKICVEAEGYLRACEEATVRPEQEVEVDFELTWLEPGSLAGVTYTANSSQEERMPLPHVKILLLPPIELNTADTAIINDVEALVQKAFLVIESNDKGEFKIDELAPGLILLVAYKPGYLPTAQLARIVPGETTFKEIGLKPIFIRPTATPTNPPTPTPNPEPEFGSIVGTVKTTENGAIVPVAGALVELWPKWSAANTTGSVRTTRTAENGSFGWRVVEPGAYILKVKTESFLNAEREVRVQAGETTTVDILLLRPPQTGGIKVAAMTGPFWDSRSLPISGARVIVELLTDFGDPVHVEKLTGEDGICIFDRLPAGPYGIKVGARGYIPQEATVEVKANALTFKSFALQPVPTAVAILSGQVTDPGDAPVPGAFVSAKRTDIATFATTVPYRTQTNEKGQYELVDIEPGVYEVIVEKPGYERAKATGVQVVAGAETTQDFELTPVPPEVVTATGLIVPNLLLNPGSRGTHVLTNSLGLPPLHLQSSTIDLTQYEQKICTITGTVVEPGASWIPLVEVTEISVVSPDDGTAK